MGSTTVVLMALAHACVYVLRLFFLRLNPACTRQSLLSESNGWVSVETRLLNGTAKIEQMGTDMPIHLQGIDSLP